MEPTEPGNQTSGWTSQWREIKRLECFQGLRASSVGGRHQLPLIGLDGPSVKHREYLPSCASNRLLGKVAGSSPAIHVATLCWSVSVHLSTHGFGYSALVLTRHRWQLSDLLADWFSTTAYLQILPRARVILARPG